jgi:hypothetical protein
MTLDLSQYLPPKVLEYAFENHIRLKMVDRLENNTWGEYRVDDDMIVINAGLDLESTKKSLERILGLTLEKSEVWTAVLLHEIGHFSMRKKLNELDKISGSSDAETLIRLKSFRAEMELEAWNFCIREFWKSRFDSSVMQDYRRWRDGLAK